MIPVVKDRDTFNSESIRDYLGRIPKCYSNIPECVIENWVHRHNAQFIEIWEPLHPDKWCFELISLSNEEIMSIKHLSGELEHYDYVGNKLLGKNENYQYVANYMAEHGTFPSPIIVAINAGHIQHPRGGPGENMQEPMQLLEGHRRIGFIREMNRQKWPSLKESHLVWAVKFNA